MENKVGQIVMVPVDKIIPNNKNNNIHSKEQKERAHKIFDASGFRSPLLISNRTGKLVAGHLRLEVSKEKGVKELPCMFQDFKDEAEEYAHLTADNALGSWSELDLSMVNTEMLDLGPDFDIDLLGIKDFVIEPVEKFDPQSDEDAVPDVVHPITRKGDLWLLGNHRLLCGDSTMIDDVEKLMNGEKMDLVHTDPPYGINEKCDREFASSTRLAKGNKFHQIKNDDSTDCAIDAYNLCDSLGISRQVWWGANYYCHSLPQTNNWLVWDKRVEEKQKDANSDCELAFVKSKWSSVRIFRHLWKGMIKASEHGQARVHPTQKPIALIEWVIDYYKEDFKNVLDLFLGSGSTLIACEKKDKKCFGMELDEKYCDVIIKRWEAYTGKKATLELTNQTYEELKAERDS